MRNILVTGANGQLGRCIADVWQQTDASDCKIYFTDVDTLDITSHAAIEQYVEDNGVATIINCAAYTNVDNAETDADNARRINASAPELLGITMKKRGGRVVHVSTDYVYGGECAAIPLKETDPTAPSSVYGSTKLEGERLLAATGVNCAILRTSWLYSEYGRNFLLTMRHLTATRDNLKVVYDQVGTPTYAGDLARVLLSIAHKPEIEGIFHYSNMGVCSWYDFAKAIADAFHHHECRIEPCLSSQYPSKVKRPGYSVLDKSKITERLNISIPHWHDSMLKCIAKIYDNR